MKDIYSEDQVRIDQSDETRLEALIQEGPECDRRLTESDEQILRQELQRIQLDPQHLGEKRDEVRQALRRLRIDSILRRRRPKKAVFRRMFQGLRSGALTVLRFLNP